MKMHELRILGYGEKKTNETEREKEGRLRLLSRGVKRWRVIAWSWNVILKHITQPPEKQSEGEGRVGFLQGDGSTACRIKTAFSIYQGSAMILHSDIVTFNFPMSYRHAIANELIIILSTPDKIDSETFSLKMIFLFFYLYQLFRCCWNMGRKEFLKTHFVM